MELWKPPAARPKPLLPRPEPKHPSYAGTMFVSGPCSWCGDAFTAPAADWERRSLYCSPRCSKSAERARRGRFVVPPRVRLAIYERDGWRCHLCGGSVDRTLGPSHRWAATLDHVQPRSRTLWPDDSPENLRLAHRMCNSVKRDTVPVRRRRAVRTPWGAPPAPATALQRRSAVLPGAVST